MNAKPNKVLIILSILTLLLLSTSWNVFGGDNFVAVPGPALSLEGIWTTMIPASPDLLSINSFVIGAQGSEGMVYNVVVKHPQCSTTLLNIFPESERLSDMIGYCVRTGTNTFRLGTIWHGIKNGGPERMGIGEIVFMGVISGTLELTDNNILEFTGTISGYAPDQDTNGDRLPDDGAVPVICAPASLTLKRLPMLPSCEPAPLPFP
jgi:hypothetical protein